MQPENLNRAQLLIRFHSNGKNTIELNIFIVTPQIDDGSGRSLCERRPPAVGDVQRNRVPRTLDLTRSSLRWQSGAPHRGLGARTGKLFTPGAIEIFNQKTFKALVCRMKF